MIAGQACACGAVGSPSTSANQPATAGWKRSAGRGEAGSVRWRCPVAEIEVTGMRRSVRRVRRPGTDLGNNVPIGNSVETKEAALGEGTKANHLTYLGDVTIGRDTNIGAGTITCNYDGFHKYRTAIGDRVQVGSDTTLVAPIKLGDDVYVATASTVRHDVPAGALVFNQREEQVREGWTEQKRRKMKGQSK